MIWYVNANAPREGNGLKDTANAVRAAGEPTKIMPDPALLERVIG